MSHRVVFRLKQGRINDTLLSVKIPITCTQCVFPNDGSAADHILYAVQVRDDDCYELTCRRGHKSVTIVQNEKFETLFQVSLNAIIDGYYRDAVASATSSLERFYEFFVSVVSREHQILSAELDAAWKHVSRQSERQIGMFVAAYLLHFRKAPVLMANDDVQFRNEVIHKGRIPTKDEAIRYVNRVLALIRPLLLEMKPTMLNSINAMTMERVKGRAAPLGNVQVSTMASVCPVSIAAAEKQQPKTIEPTLKTLTERRYQWGWR